MSEVKFPQTFGSSLICTIHPAREESNVRYGAGVQYDIVFKLTDGRKVVVFPGTKQFDLMRKYEWVYVEDFDNSDNCGWVSLLIPFDKMFEKFGEKSNA